MNNSFSHIWKLLNTGFSVSHLLRTHFAKNPVIFLCDSFTKLNTTGSSIAKYIKLTNTWISSYILEFGYDFQNVPKVFDLNTLVFVETISEIIFWAMTIWHFRGYETLFTPIGTWWKSQQILKFIRTYWNID